MSEIISLLWGIAGVIFVMAGKDFIYVFACFLLCGVFLGAAELRDIKKALGNFKLDVKLFGEDEDD